MTTLSVRLHILCDARLEMYVPVVVVVVVVVVTGESEETDDDDDEISTKQQTNLNEKRKIKWCASTT